MIETIKNLALSDWGSISSISGLIITIITLMLVRSIKRSFIFKARISDLHNDLGTSTSEISFLLRDFNKNEYEIETVLATVAVTLRNICNKSSKPLKSDAKKAFKMIKRCRIRWFLKWKLINPKERSIRKIYTELNTVIEEMKNLQKDMEVE